MTAKPNSLSISTELSEDAVLSNTQTSTDGYDPELFESEKAFTVRSPSDEVKPLPLTFHDAFLHAVDGGTKSFLIGYGSRGVFLFVLRLFRFLRNKESLSSILQSSFISSDAWQFAVSAGGFSFIWKVVNNLMRIKRNKKSRINGAVAGGFAALSLFALDKDYRTSLSVQMILRAFQLLYNYHKKRGRIHLPVGDAFLFAGSCASIMHGFAVESESLPRSFRGFMSKMAEVPQVVLNANQDLIESDGSRFDIITSLGALLKRMGGTSGNINEAETMARIWEDSGVDQLSIVLPCSCNHPRSDSCIRHNFLLFFRTIWNILPLNAALNVVPMIFLKNSSFLKHPISLLANSMKHALRSSTFLGAYVVIFKSLICLHKNSASPIHGFEFLSRFMSRQGAQRIVYAISGFVCAFSSVFIEQKKRRGELALYTVPKALDALHFSVYSNKLLQRRLPKNLDMAAAVVAFSIIMGFYESHSECMSPMLNGVLVRLFGRN